MQEYPKALKKDLHKYKPPIPIAVDIVRFEKGLALRVYAEEVMKFGANDRIALMSYLLNLKDIVESYGIECVLDGLDYRNV